MKRTKSQHGGMRKGAGRPTRYGVNLRRRTVWLTDAQAERLKRIGSTDSLSRAVQNIADQ